MLMGHSASPEVLGTWEQRARKPENPNPKNAAHILHWHTSHPAVQSCQDATRWDKHNGGAATENAVHFPTSKETELGFSFFFFLKKRMGVIQFILACFTTSLSSKKKKETEQAIIHH